MNNVVLIGRLTRDPELRYLQNGTAIAKFSLAIDRNMAKDKKEEAQKNGQPTADFPNIVVWGKQAENCANYLVKGRLVAIQGRIQTGSYDAQDGTKRYTTDVVAERVQFLEWSDKQSNNANTNSNSYEPDGFSPIDDDDLPF